jgi:hypothetical protein
MGACAPFVTLLILLPACSGADGLDLPIVDGGIDSTTTSHVTDGSNAVPEASSAGTEAAVGDDMSTADDAATGPQAGGGVALDGALSDASSEGGPPSFCSAICNGCCDALGQCLKGDSTAVCGASGSMCLDCSKHTCAVTSGACCTAKGTCGCSLAGLLGCE